MIRLLFFFGFFINSLSSPSEYFSSEDAENIDKLLNSLEDKNSGAWSSLKDTYFAVDLKNKLKLQINNKDKILKFVKENSKSDSLESLFYSSSIHSILKEPFQGADAVKKTVVSGLESQNLFDLAFASGIFFNLKKSFEIPVHILEEAVENIVNLFDEEYGTWFLDEGKDESSAYLAGLALTALSQLSPHIDDQTPIENVASSISELFSISEENDEKKIMFFRHTDNEINSLKATSVVIKGISDFCEITKEKREDNIEWISNFLISQKFVTSLEDAHSLVVGLTKISSSVFKKFLVLSLENTRIFVVKGSDRESNIKVKISDIWGEFAVPTKVFLTKAYLSGKEDLPLLANQELPLLENSKNIFSLDFLAARPDPGSFILEFRVAPQEKHTEYKAITSASRNIQVVAQVALTDGFFSISENSENYGNQINFEQGKKINADLELKGTNSLAVGFKLRNLVSNRLVQAHQVFLKFEEKNSRKLAYFVVPVVGQGYEIKLSLSKLASTLNSVSGDYSVEIIIGDSFISKSFRWIVASIKIKFDSLPEEEKISEYFGPKPIIEHKFRPSANLAPDFVTLIFSILVLLPFFGFISSVLSHGNLADFPTSGLYPIYSLLFLGGVGALLALIIFYWLALNLFVALELAGILVPPTFLFGNWVLGYYASNREKNK